MVQKLSVQIQLEGAQEIEQQLAGVSQAGQQCFADIIKAAEQVGGFAKLDPTVIADKFKQFGITATGEIDKINAAVKSSAKLEGTVLGVAELERGFKKAGEAATQATAAFGLTRREIGALSRAFRAIDLGPMGSQLALIGRVGGAFGPVGITITAIAVAIAGLGAALVKFASSAEETEKALTQLQNVSGQSFASLSALANVFAQGGTSVKQFASEFGNLSEKIAAAGEAAAKQQAIKQQAEDAAKGLKVTELGAITLDERVKALLETLSTVPPTQQWFALADIFKKLGDTGQELERARIGQALGLSPESIATLSQGSEALRQLQAQAEQMGLTLTSSNQQALQEMGQGWNQFTGLLSALFQKIGATAAPAFTQILAAFQPVMQQIAADFQNMPIDQAVANLGTRLAPVFQALGQVLTPIVTALGTAAGTAFANAVMAAITSGLTPKTSLWQAILDDFTKFGQSIVQNAGILGEKIKRALGFGGGGGAPAPSGGTAPGMAAGGLLGGRGTGTSDSNLAWVSRGEYITPARAVAQPGVLAFLEALRRSGGNLSRVLDGMGRFALGGMVPRSAMAFAGGGPIGSMSHVTIAFPGLPEISGLRASSDVVDQLHRAAALAQVRSGGRKPSRYS